MWLHLGNGGMLMMMMLPQKPLVLGSMVEGK
jgi:hypothetical protein